MIPRARSVSIRGTPPRLSTNERKSARTPGERPLPLEHIVHLLIALAAALALGRVATRFGQSSAIGEILAGVLVALTVTLFPETVPFLPDIGESPAIDLVGEAGIFALLLLAGIEMKREEIARYAKTACAVGTGGLLLPLAGGFALAWAFLPDTDLKQAQALTVGIGLAVTAIPVSVKVFEDFGLLHERVGEIVISAAIVDDVLALLLLAVVTSLITTGAVPDLASLALLLAKVGAFFALALIVGFWALPPIWRVVARQGRWGLRLGVLLLLALAFSLLAEALGAHFVLGPFMAGLFFEEASVGEEGYRRVREAVRTFTLGFLAPIFFVSLGLRLDLGAVPAIPGFLAALLLVAFAGKLVGAGLPALWAGLDARSALAVGVGMSGRGAVELVVVSIAEKAGVFAPAAGADALVSHLFSALVLVALVTTLATPVLLRLVLARR